MNGSNANGSNLMPATRTTRLAHRVPLREACRVLGISVDSFERRWRGVFTDYRTDSGYRLVSEDELECASRYTEPAAARAAVMSMRLRLGRA